MIKISDFFDETKLEEKEEETTEPEKIKVGEKEYTQDELNKVVGLGETASEYEQKWNSPIKDIYKGYTQTTQEKKELEKQLEEFKNKQTETKVQAGAELTPEELRERARTEAKSLGIPLEEDVRNIVAQQLDAIRLLDDTKTVVAQAKEDYGIETNVEDLIAYMQETGFRNPEKAFKDKYESDIDKAKETKLESIKKPGMVTDSTSSAGAKNPSIIRPNNENIGGLIEELLARE